MNYWSGDQCYLCYIEHRSIYLSLNLVHIRQIDFGISDYFTRVVSNTPETISYTLGFILFASFLTWEPI